MNNLWSYLLSALLFFIEVVIIPLFGGPGAYHKAMGLSNLIGYNATVVLEVAFDALASFDLELIFICFKATLVIWTIQAGVAMYVTIKGLITPG